MRMYELTYRLSDGAEGHYEMAAKDRSEAIRFIKHLWRGRKPKVLSAKLKKDETPTPEAVAVLDVEESIVQMREKALRQVEAAPYSGSAIGRYLKLVLATDLTSNDVHNAVVRIVRLVDNHNEKQIQNKAL